MNRIYGFHNHVNRLKLHQIFLHFCSPTNKEIKFLSCRAENRDRGFEAPPEPVNHACPAHSQDPTNRKPAFLDGSAPQPITGLLSAAPPGLSVPLSKLDQPSSLLLFRSLTRFHGDRVAVLTPSTLRSPRAQPPAPLLVTSPLKRFHL